MTIALCVSDPVRLPGEETRYTHAVRSGPAKEPGRVTPAAMVHTDLAHSRGVPIPVYGRIVPAAEGTEADSG